MRNRRNAIGLLIALTFFLTPQVSAQYLIENFRPKIKGSPTVDGLEVQSDGKIILLGEFAFAGEDDVKGILRLNSDGSLDNTFQLDDRLPTLYMDPEVSSGKHAFVVEGQNGDLVIGTHTTPTNVFIIDNTGQIKSEINTPTGYFQTEIIEPYRDGYLAVAQTSDQMGIFKLDEFGEMDDTFSAFEFTGSVSSLAVDSENNILVLGSILVDGNTTNLAKINSLGSMDENFSSLEFQVAFASLEVLSSDDIILGGIFNQINDVGFQYGLAKLDTNGNIDDSFSKTALQGLIDETVYDFAVEPNTNTLVIVARQQGGGQIILGADEAGSLNTGFSAISLDISFPRGILDYGNGNFSYTTNFEFSLNQETYTFLNFDSTGQLDLEVSGKVELFGAGIVKVAVELSDGDILIGGEFSHVNNTQVNNLARLNIEGIVDIDFNNNHPLISEDEIEKIIVDENDNIYLGGFFHNHLGISELPIMRIENDGSIDTGFEINLSSGASYTFLSDFILMDDRIIFCGQFSNEIRAVNFQGQNIESFNVDFEGKNVGIKSLSEVDDQHFAISGEVFNDEAFIWILELDGTLSSSFARHDTLDFRPNHLLKIGNVLYNSGSLGSGSSADPNYIYQYDLGNGDLTETDFATFGFGDNKHFSSLNETTFLLVGDFGDFNGVEVYDFVAADPDGIVNERYRFDVSTDAKEYSAEGTTVLSGNRFLVMGRFTRINDQEIYSLGMISTENFVPEVNFPEEIVVKEDSTFNLFDLIEINDLDDTPTITVTENENFDVDVTGILTLIQDYNGATDIMFEVSDGMTTSEIFTISFEVTSLNDAPVITGLVSELITVSGIPISLSLNDLVVTDPDNVFPGDFTLSRQSGENYTISENLILPNENFTGILEVPVVVSDGVDDSNTFFALIGVEEPLGVLDGSRFSLYPNPTTGLINISSEEKVKGISVYNISGTKILSFTIDYNGFDNRNFDLSKLTSGIYLIRVELESDVVSSVVVKR